MNNKTEQSEAPAGAGAGAAWRETEKAKSITAHPRETLWRRPRPTDMIHAHVHTIIRLTVQCNAVLVHAVQSIINVAVNVNRSKSYNVFGVRLGITGAFGNLFLCHLGKSGGALCLFLFRRGGGGRIWFEVPSRLFFAVVYTNTPTDRQQ